MTGKHRRGELIGGHNILGDPGRQDDVVGPVGPDHGKGVVSHVPSPGPSDPADIIGRYDLQDRVVDFIVRNRVREGDAESDMSVAVVRGKGQARLGVGEHG